MENVHAMKIIMIMNQLNNVNIVIILAKIVQSEVGDDVEIIFRFDEDIGHTFIPNLNARVMNENGGYFVTTNSDGFRSDHN